MIQFISATLIVLLTIISGSGMEAPKQAGSAVYPGPPIIIYKTKADYSKNVPVTLSDDKTTIISYPAVKDLYTNGKLAYPKRVAKGYWLDYRGISVHSAFIKLTYEEYSKLKEAPSINELNSMIIDRDPFTKMYNLGQRYKYRNLPEAVDSIIKGGRMEKYLKLK